MVMLANKIVMLAKSKLESKISKTLINNENNHNDFETIIDEGKKFKKHFLMQRNLTWLRKEKNMY